MYYAPHTLQKKSTECEKDSYGRIITSTEAWIDICACRCDDNTITEIRDNNGQVYRPKYHIVADGYADVKAGDHVRCLLPNGTIRGEGKVYNVKHLNVLKYTDIWV